MPFEFKRFSELPEIILIEPRVFADERGWFMEAYKKSEFARQGINAEFNQDNRSRSTAKGTIRGLHYQNEPAAQGKVVCCIVGEILDVAVDIRKGSPTYGRWVSAVLSEENHRALWIPSGFAHGLCTMAEVTEIGYKVTAEYSASHDRSIRWNDPSIGIKWPTMTPILSKKDAEAPFLRDADNNHIWRPAD
jgi:dTDP-4-dehydrorhamnose 3,5-epimerase